MVVLKKNIGFTRYHLGCIVGMFVMVFYKTIPSFIVAAILSFILIIAADIIFEDEKE